MKTRFVLILVCVMSAMGVSCGAKNDASGGDAASSTTWVTADTHEKIYTITVAEDYSRVPSGQLHAWLFMVQSADGQPVTPAQFTVSGSMPGHGHGMTTFPLTNFLPEAGSIRVDGMKFHMSGEWKIQVEVGGAAGSDHAEFTVNILPPAVESEQAIVAFDQEEIELLRSMSIDTLPDYNGDPSNRYSQLSAAVALGEALFMEPGLSASGTVACSNCHQPERYFTDGRELSFGSANTKRHAPGLLGVAHSNWFYWDGRRDSLWAQAVTPIETPGEMDSTRVDAVRYVVSHTDYGPAFKTLTGHGRDAIMRIPEQKGIGPFGSNEGKNAWHKLPGPVQERVNSAFTAIGKVIAAYEETLMPAPSRFDRFIDALVSGGDKAAAEIFNASELRGAKLFISSESTDCMRCHNGPMLSNQEFHNIATATDREGNFDIGRDLGLKAARFDSFNCLGFFSDAPREACITLRYVRQGHLDAGAFKTPTLRNISHTAPYMHHGQFADLERVLLHYRFPPPGPEDSHEIPKLELSDQDTDDLITFLKTL